ncbi:hypothetical protein D3C86_1645590 [compost metagenome]
MYALRDDADSLTQGRFAKVGQRCVVKQNFTQARVPGTGKQLQQSGFTAAGSPQNSNVLARRNCQTNAIQCVLC